MLKINCNYDDFNEGMLNNAPQQQNKYQQNQKYTKINKLIMISILATVLLILVLVKLWFRGSQYQGSKQLIRGKVAVVTGGASGIGAEIVKELVSLKCTVIIADITDAVSFCQSLNTAAGQQLAHSFKVDLGSRKSIEHFVAVELSKWSSIDYLINNAGVLTGSRAIQYSVDGKELHYGVNFLGHFLLTHLLWPKLSRSKGKFRILNTSSNTHLRVGGFFAPTSVDFDNFNFQDIKFDFNLAYARSKLYITMFTHTIAEKARNQGVVFSVHPGIVRSQMVRNLHSGFLLSTWYYLGYAILWLVTKSCKEGAQTHLHLLLTPEGQLRTGAYYADCKQAEENKEATEENCERLFGLTCAMLKLKFGEQK